MPVLHAAASAVIDAPQALLYSLLADYREAHPLILPPAFGNSLMVEEGGRGAGTRIRFQVRLLGQTRTVHARIDEPEPGAVLSETDLDTGAVTRFALRPTPDGRTHVTIATTWEKPGLAARVEGWLATPLLRRLYRDELANLARVAESFVRARAVA